MNLVLNVVKFMSEGEVNISVKSVGDGLGNVDFWVEVSDMGIGMDWFIIDCLF